MSLRRYAREVDVVAETFGGWHEMVGDDNDTLCHLRLVPMPFGRDEDLLPLVFHQVRGTGFPGKPCDDCLRAAEWRDQNAIYRTYPTAEFTL